MHDVKTEIERQKQKQKPYVVSTLYGNPNVLYVYNVIVVVVKFRNWNERRERERANISDCYFVLLANGKHIPINEAIIQM